MRRTRTALFLLLFTVIVFAPPLFPSDTNRSLPAGTKPLPQQPVKLNFWDTGKWLSSLTHSVWHEFQKYVGSYFRPIITEAHASITRVQGNARGTSSSGTSLTVTLASTPTNGNVIILLVSARKGDFFSQPTVSSVSETNVSWSKQTSFIWDAGTPSGIQAWMNGEIWLGTVSSSAGTTITVTFANSFGIAIGDACEYSGLATSSTLDITANNNGYGTTQDTGTTSTTIQASELWVGLIFAAGGSGVATQSSPTNGFTLLDGANFDDGVLQYNSLGYLEKIVSSTGTANSGTTTTNGNNYYTGVIATFKAVSTVTENVTLSISPGGAPNQGNVAISGCSPSPTTIAIDGGSHAITADPSCSITFTVAADGSNVRDRFSNGGTASTTWTFTTAASGSESKSNTVYHQLQTTYQVTAKAQATFDTGMTWTITSTVLGSASSTVCTISSTAASTDSCLGWNDYGTSFSYPTASSSPPANSRWQASGTTSSSYIAGGNTFNVDYYKQLTNTYQATPNGQTTWDAGLTAVTVTGTLLGSTGQTICSITLTSGGGTASCSGYSDYNTQTSMPSTIGTPPSGARWISQGTISWTDTSGGQTHTANYWKQYQNVVFGFKDNSGTFIITCGSFTVQTSNSSSINNPATGWVTAGTSTLTAVTCYGTNTRPASAPTVTINVASATFYFNIRIYSVSLPSSMFKDNGGTSLYANPSSFTITTPNSTTITTTGTYLIQNGTSTLSAVTWEGTSVVPSSNTFDASNGNPTFNLKIYALNLKHQDNLNNLLAQTVTLTFPNTTAIAKTTSSGWTNMSQIQTGTITITTPISVSASERYVLTSSSSISLTSSLTQTENWRHDLKNVLFQMKDNSGVTILSPQPSSFTVQLSNSTSVSNPTSSTWVATGTTTLTACTWEGSNVEPLSAPTVSVTSQTTWYFAIRVYSTTPTWKDNSANALTTAISSYKWTPPNSTLSTTLTPTGYMLQNGTTTISAVLWRTLDVTPSAKTFDPTNGSPSFNLQVYKSGPSSTFEFALDSGTASGIIWTQSTLNFTVTLTHNTGTAPFKLNTGSQGLPTTITWKGSNQSSTWSNALLTISSLSFSSNGVLTILWPTPPNLQFQVLAKDSSTIITNAQVTMNNGTDYTVATNSTGWVKFIHAGNSPTVKVKWENSWVYGTSISTGPIQSQAVNIYINNALAFRYNDNSTSFTPTQIQITAPNGTTLTLTSYTLSKMQNGTWTIIQIKYWANNIVPASNPTFIPTTNSQTRQVATQIFSTTPIWKDSVGGALTTTIASYKVTSPNSTLSSALTAGLPYWVQNGTSTFSAILWNALDVTPASPTFNAASGSPTTNLRVYKSGNGNEFEYALDGGTTGSTAWTTGTDLLNTTLTHSTGTATFKLNTGTRNTPLTVKTNGANQSSTYSNGLITMSVSFASNSILTITWIPNTPTSLAVIADSQAPASVLDLSWTAPSSDYTNFQIERSLDQNTWTKIANVTSTSYHDLALSSQTTYYYRLRAWRSSDNSYSTYSTVASAITQGGGGGGGGKQLILYVKVVDTSNLIITGATVTIGGNNVTSDQHGIAFIASTLIQGDYVLLVSATGYQPQTITLHLIQSYPLESPYTVTLSKPVSTATTTSKTTQGGPLSFIQSNIQNLGITPYEWILIALIGIGTASGIHFRPKPTK